MKGKLPLSWPLPRIGPARGCRGKEERPRRCNWASLLPVLGTVPRWRIDVGFRDLAPSQEASTHQALSRSATSVSPLRILYQSEQNYNRIFQPLLCFSASPRNTNRTARPITE